MSIGQEHPAPAQYGTEPQPPGGHGVPPQRDPGTNGLSIAGIILAFVAAPIGLVLSIIGLVLAGRRGQKGRGLAIAGIVISVVVMAGATAAIAVAGKTVAKLADPGCITGKAAILDNATKISNQDTMKEGLQATVAGLNSAAGKATHADVRNAMTTLSADYATLLGDIDTGTVPDAALQAKVDTDGKKVDSLCTIGGAK
ncbi:MAG: peptidyl-prolyl cis-trans isomerase [Micromonosporaceae bacterium]|jgi:hypothetical protein|nr:peptidyl-prolyl cis-trans isomerase [Micromonosporaceae bacterium]